MKTNVQFKNVKYVVKPKEGVVVCTMEVDPQLNKLYDLELGYNYTWLKSLPMISGLGLFTAKGIAKCSKGDKFDETLGKRIAESKAKKMAFGITNTIHNIIFNKLTNAMSEYANIARGCSKAYVKEIEHINYLLEEASKKGE